MVLGTEASTAAFTTTGRRDFVSREAGCTQTQAVRSGTFVYHVCVFVNTLRSPSNPPGRLHAQIHAPMLVCALRLETR